MASKGKLVFGTAGIPHSSRALTTQAGIERSYELGLGCMEVEFVRGVNMSPESARDVGRLAAKRGLKLSAHAPYFINLNAKELEKMAASQERIIQTARIASLFGGNSIVFHAAFYLKDEPAKVYATVKKNLQQIVAKLRAEGNRVLIRPEVMGRDSQFGTLEEIVQLSLEVDGVAPTLDFAHWHARTGKANSYDSFIAVLKKIEGKLGRAALDNMHIHLSGINYNNKSGEIMHLNLKESDFAYTELLQALKEQNARGVVICESPNLEEDALHLQETYYKV